VIDLLITQIGKSIYEQYRDKFIFAISVHSIECWLLPTVSKTTVHSKTVNCLGALNNELQRHQGFTIDSDNKNPKYYRRISEVYKKHKKLQERYMNNPSLKIFVESVQNMGIILS
jgi:hypothetical protein